MNASVQCPRLSPHHCPEFDNDRARWELKQIRSADESETRFFSCTECGHKWREDDH